MAAADKRRALEQQARRWLGTPEGRREMMEDIRETLVVNMLYDKEEGVNLREHQKSGPAAARQARKQYRETAELVHEITKELERK